MENNSLLLIAIALGSHAGYLFTRMKQLNHQIVMVKKNHDMDMRIANKRIEILDNEITKLEQLFNLKDKVNDETISIR